MSIFIRLLDTPTEAKSERLLQVIGSWKAETSTGDGVIFEIELETFKTIPGCPFSYWVSQSTREAFSRFDAFESDDRTVKVGLQTSEDERFVRAWWEIPPMGFRKKWYPFAKGGTVSSFYEDLPLCVDWSDNGSQSWAIYEARRAVVGGMIKNPDYYFRPGLTWPLRARAFSPQPLPAGCIFSLRSYSAFVKESDLLATLGLFNTAIFDYLFKLALGRFGFPEFVIGILQKIPWPNLTCSEKSELEQWSLRTWSLKRRLDTGNEISHAFTFPIPLLGRNLAETQDAIRALDQSVRTELAIIQSNLDHCGFDIYGILESDRQIIQRTLTNESTPGQGSVDAVPIIEEDSEPQEAETDYSVAARLTSWAVGVAFGRFDVRLVTGARPMPPDPKPFDPLPLCSPGMLTGDDSQPAAQSPPGYPIPIPQCGVLVDDPGHADDLTAAVKAVFREVFAAGSDRWWDDVSALLDHKGHDLRTWLRAGFFEYHLKRYSKGRRRAPIFWQLGTTSGCYSVWLYVHRLTRDSFFLLQNEVVGPKLAHEERQLASLWRDNPSARERKALALQETVVEELRTMLEDVMRVAPLWNPNLDDGVVLTMAPLWRLVPQHKAWQKELKSRWDLLAAGKYDWTHLAMHLWPERVVPKCATDRTLAIAHGLVETFWTEGSNGKWRPRPDPLTPVTDLVAERTSPAVKAALDILLEAPAPGSAGNSRGRKGKGGS